MRFPKDVQVGKYYEVPHVLCRVFGGLENVLLPINTPLHDDKDYIKLNVRHYHVDWRFVSKRIYDISCNYGGNGVYKTLAEQKTIICEEDNFGHRNIGEIVYKNVKCKRQFSNKDFHHQHERLYKTWPVELQKGYCGIELKKNNEGQYVCPHKGAIIDLTYVDEHGYAVCPAHLLRFDTKTLKAIHSLPNRIVAAQECDASKAP